MNYIYALYDSGSMPRYVGKSKNPQQRLTEHIFRAKNGEHTHKGSWIRSLLGKGEQPQVAILEACGEDWPDRETFWIKEGRRIGWNLVNHNDGGTGGDSSYVTDKTRASLSAKLKGLKRSDITRARISAVRKGKPLSQSHKDAIKASCGGWHHTDEAKARISNARKGNKSGLGHKHSEETRAKIAKGNKGKSKSLTTEQRAAIAERFRLTRNSPAARAKISAFHKGRPKSEAWHRSHQIAMAKRELELLKGKPRHDLMLNKKFVTIEKDGYKTNWALGPNSKRDIYCDVYAGDSLILKWVFRRGNRLNTLQANAEHYIGRILELSKSSLQV